MKDNTYLVQYSHPIIGKLTLGTVCAESQEVAGAKLLELIKKYGVPDEYITYDAAAKGRISLKSDVTLTVFQVMDFDESEDLFRHLVAKAEFYR